MFTTIDTKQRRGQTGPAPAPCGEGRTSVIIPTHNRAAMLEQCLSAVRSQTISPLELIVVDDGSTDETQAIVAQAAPEARLMVQPNRGKAAALNAAMALVRGEFVWIIDDDDIVLPHALEHLTRLLDQTPEADFAYGRHDRFMEAANGQRLMLGTGYWHDCTQDEFLQATLEDFFAHQPGMLVRRSAYIQVGAFDEALIRSQDYEMTLRLARVCTPVKSSMTVFLQRTHYWAKGNKE